MKSNATSSGLGPSNFLFFNQFPVMLLRSVESVESVSDVTIHDSTM
jgi:hypothetical protein